MSRNIFWTSLFALVPALFVMAFVLAPADAHAQNCGWVQDGAKYCQADVAYTGQDGRTLGEDYMVRNGITDPGTRPNARDLHPGEQNIIVDKFNICRYLGNYFGTGALPFRAGVDELSR